jgi:hypothetical protein
MFEIEALLFWLYQTISFSLGNSAFNTSILSGLAYILSNHDFSEQSTHYFLEERRQLR